MLRVHAGAHNRRKGNERERRCSPRRPPRRCAVRCCARPLRTRPPCRSSPCPPHLPACMHPQPGLIWQERGSSSRRRRLEPWTRSRRRSGWSHPTQSRPQQSRLGVVMGGWVAVGVTEVEPGRAGGDKGCPGRCCDGKGEQGRSDVGSHAPLAPSRSAAAGSEISKQSHARSRV